MEEYNVIETERTKQNITLHKLDVGREALEVRRLTDVWAGLQPSIGSLPPYYCILGQQWHEPDLVNETGSIGKFIFFAEYQPKSLVDLDRFLLKLTDDIVRFHCTEVYTLLGDEYQGYKETYENYLRDNNIKLGTLREAPFCNDFLLGTSLINRYRTENKLSLPEGIVKQEFNNLFKVSMDDSPETKFPAINALRYVIGAFHKYAPRPVPDWISQKKKRSWMMA